ncbi:FAD/NAD(P)-binding oxidoreductase [Kribbella sancticallisti]|uniref:FAD/NAD(P)-binding oxidoreductase n=1 Tax=Kribbella sancticallisti TaxID=460087 RepID=A0ABP4PZV0_9ACTN
MAAASAGVEVLLVDAAPAVGGQFNRQLPTEFHARRPERLQHGWGAFVRLRDRIAADERIDHLTSTSVWALERGSGRTRLWLQRGPADASGREIFAVEAPAVVLATGAYDRVLPFPGWDLPGVYSAGAAQALAKGQRIAIGRRVVVAGTGPFLLPVAESLIGVGAEVVELLEANRPSTVARGWLSDPLVAVSKLAEAGGYARLLAGRRIPLRHGRTVIAAHGTDRVEAVTTARLDNNWTPIRGTERRVEVDAVCLGFGFTPQLELALSARCKLGTGPDGASAVIVDANQQTTTPGIYAAGELTGIGGAALAATEGQIAGASAAALAGASDAATAEASSSTPFSVPAELWKRVVRGRRFAVALARAYPVMPGWKSWSDGGTLVCRCEEVSRGALEGVVSRREVGGGRSFALSSRVGLGLCQGRVCARTAGELAGVQQSDNRPIAQPVRLEDLAKAEILEDL